MTRKLALSDFAASWPWFRNARIRRTIFAAAILVLALLALFPTRYVANVKLAPQDTNTAGLSSILSQLGGNYAALLGNHQPVEIDLAIGRSFDVQRNVARDLAMIDGTDPRSTRAAVRKLEKKVDVRALRAGIIEVEVSDRDPDDALRIATAYARAMQHRLAELSREQTAYKRGVLNERMREATDRLARAEAAITRFRQNNQVISPETQLSDAVAQLSALRAQYQAVQVELAKARRFNSPQSFQVKSIETALGAIQGQIRQAEGRARGANGLTATGIAPKTLEYQRLDRELRFAQALYESYTRYLEGASVENLTADFNMQLIEPPFLEPDRKFNRMPMALLVVMLLLAFASEFYLFRPPLGRRFAVR